MHVKRKILIYIAGPLGKPENWPENTANAICAGDRVMAFHPEVVCYVPHCTGPTWDAKFHHSYEWWIEYCLGMVAKADAVYRIAGDSPGADQEVRLAKDLGIPVFHTMSEISDWLRDGYQAPAIESTEKAPMYLEQEIIRREYAEAKLAKLKKQILGQIYSLPKGSARSIWDDLLDTCRSEGTD